MEEFLRDALLIGAVVLIAMVFGSRLLRLAGGVVIALALFCILIKAPADSTLSALATGAALFGLGTWWRHRRLRRVYGPEEGVMATDHGPATQDDPADPGFASTTTRAAR